ncbi:MAG: hypothetical protein ACYC36_06035 [Bellilinea sp.]
MTTATRSYCAAAWVIYDRWLLLAQDPDAEEAAVTAMVAELDAHVKACTDCK